MNMKINLRIEAVSRLLARIVDAAHLLDDSKVYG